MPAEEAARTMELPPGFRCQVFAAEPDVRQPIAMTWDARGRLWIAECYTYAKNPGRWNTELRDRILIFEDRDNDGHFDKRRVFWDKGQRLTSIEIGDGGVYALVAPDLIFIPDKNGDDVPDGPPRVLLDGFDFKTVGHNIVNGLRWGPDGWLYGRHGISATSDIGVPGTPEKDRTRMNCGIWRYHPVQHRFEVVCQGGTNSWGMDWDAQGELFWINTVIGHLWYGIPGAYYDRMFGAHLNRHVYETIKQTADHYHFDIGKEKWNDVRKGISNKTDQLGGGHAHVGCLIYNGGQWPREYQGKLFTANLHGRRINMDILERKGCGFVGKHGADFMKSKDPWFRGLDLRTGPDGSVFVIDWSDAGECHDSDGVHRTSGRIFKISYGEPKNPGPFNLAKMNEVELEKMSALHRDNNWWERMIAEVRHPIQDKRLPPQIADASSPDGLVRLHLASGLQDLPPKARFPVATALAAHAEDAGDLQQPLMIWYGIEPAVLPYPDQAIALAIASRIPMVRKLIARRLTEEIEKSPGPVDDLLSAALRADDEACREDILRGMSEALRGFSRATKPKHWDRFAATFNGDRAETVRDLSVLFGSGRATDELIVLVRDTKADASARRSAFDSLLRNPKPQYFDLVRGMIDDRILGRAARLGCARFATADVPKALLRRWPLRKDWLDATVSTLSSRVSWAKQLLDFIERNPPVREDISPFQARQIQRLGDENLNQQLSRVWGELRDTPEAKKRELARWRTILTPDALAKADPEKGKVLFAGVCGACHKLYGEGGTIAPDLTGSDRHNLAYLLQNIIDPSAVVPAVYRVTLIKLKDGRTLSGVIPEQTDKFITLQTPAERLTVPRSDIAEMQQLAQSLMPEGQLQALGEENVKDIISFLMK